MRFRDAKKLRNRDQVRIRRKDNMGWCDGYVLGEIRLVNNRLIIPVHSQVDGFLEVGHVDVRDGIDINN